MDRHDGSHSESFHRHIQVPLPRFIKFNVLGAWKLSDYAFSSSKTNPDMTTPDILARGVYVDTALLVARASLTGQSPLQQSSERTRVTNTVFSVNLISPAWKFRFLRRAHSPSQGSRAIDRICAFSCKTKQSLKLEFFLGRPDLWTMYYCLAVITLHLWTHQIVQSSTLSLKVVQRMFWMWEITRRTSTLDSFPVEQLRKKGNGLNESD